MSARRWPVVTLAVIVVCTVVHVLVQLGGEARERRVAQATGKAVAAYLAAPSLGLCPSLRGATKLLDARARGAESDGAPGAALREEHDAACNELEAALDALPSHRFGYVQGSGVSAVWRVFTYAFLHGDYAHLIGNMWFLFLSGLALEDRWGRVAFPLFYAAAGVVAAIVHAVIVPGNAALIGASGAVAGCMGAFVVLFARTKIRFVGLIGYRIVWFHAPAIVMLPLWAAIEVFFAMIAARSGTAHWAHVGGFAFGVGVAAVLRVVGVDHKLDDAVERAALLGNDPRIEAARVLIAQGKPRDAQALLEGLAKEKNTSVHVWEALRDAARAAGDANVERNAAAQMARLRPSAADVPPQAPPAREPPPIAAAPSVSPPTPPPAIPVSAVREVVRESAPERVLGPSPGGAGPRDAASAPPAEAPYFPPPRKRA
jgi:membrane associated rhomboid family serine protease